MKVLRLIAVPVLSVWLLGWMVLSWGAIQDDALIHLRYAERLDRFHFITFDGVHASYGTSSLLFVGLLAALRNFAFSPLLSRAVSTAFHGLLFAGFAAFFLRSVRQASGRVQALAGLLLVLLAVPSAVRWLDDGMETGLVLCLVSVAAWWTHRLSRSPEVVGGEVAVALALGFLLVLLRNELLVVAFLAAGILVLASAGEASGSRRDGILRSVLKGGGFLLGAVVATMLIRLTMHSFLPDTALAKAHGIAHFGPSLRAGSQVLGGALLFGLGSLFLWMISAALVFLARPLRFWPSLAANLLFPGVLLLSALRGQEIQGARYLIWTLFFSLVWNVHELWMADRVSAPVAPGGSDRVGAVPAQPVPIGHRSWGAIALVLFGGICFLALPMECRLMGRVLTTRAHTMKLFMSQDLAGALRGERGVAFDVGYIAYFSGDNFCDLAGLVNGGRAAALTNDQRAARCGAEHPDFVFVSAGEGRSLLPFLDFSGWKVCGTYDFANMREPDRHYLVVKPQDAERVCRATGFNPQPASMALLETSYP